MPDAPLILPFLIDPSPADSIRLDTSAPGRLKARWTSVHHGRRAAVVDRYNSLWIYSVDQDRDKGKGAVRDQSAPAVPNGDGNRDTQGALSIAVPDITVNATSTPPRGNTVSAGPSRTPTPTTPTSAPGASGSSRLHRPSQLRSHSSASVTYSNLSRDPAYSANHRSRAASNASSILSFSSHYRRSSALSPPAASPRIGTTALSAETAQADPHAGHRHARSSSITFAGTEANSGVEPHPRASTSSTRQSGEAASRASISETELLDQLKYQCRPLSPPSERGIGLGIGFGLGNRGLALGGRSMDESTSVASALPSDAEGGGIGATSPRSTHSAESSRTLSNRFMPWRSGEEEGASAREREREKVLMEKVAEVEVEREMEREVQEDEKERAEERLVRDAQGTVTPRESMVLEDAVRDYGGEGRSVGYGTGTRRILLPDWTRGRAVRCRVVEDMSALVVLRDTGLLDIVSLDSEQHITTVRLEHARDDIGTAASSGTKSQFRLPKFWKWRDLDMLDVGPDRVLLAHGVSWSTGGMPSPNGQVTKVVMLHAVYPASLEDVAHVELAGVGGISVDTQGGRLIHHLSTGAVAYPVHSPSTRPTAGIATAKTSPSASRMQSQNRSVSALHPSAASPSGTSLISPTNGNPTSQDGLRRHRSQLLPRDTKASTAHGSSASGSASGNGVWGREGERGFAKFLGIKKEEAKESTQAEVGWGLGPGEKVDEDLRDAVSDDGTVAAAHLEVAEERDAASESAESASVVSGIVPFDVETCFVADRNGEVTKQRFIDVLSGKLHPADIPSVDRLASAVACMTVVRPDREAAYLFAGDEDGMLRIWDAQSFELLAMLSLFAFPVVSIHMLDVPQAGTLRGQVLCTSKAGTIALVSLDEMDQSFLIPAARDPLRRLFVGGKDMMMVYANGKARVWNVETLEFRRSTALDAAEDMLSGGDWQEIDIAAPPLSDLPLRNTTMQIEPGANTSRVLELDLHRLGSWLRQQRSSTAQPAGVFGSLLAILPLFLTPGMDRHIDDICERGLGVTWAKSAVQLGKKSKGTSAILMSERCGLDVWRESAEATGTRQLAIVALLRPFLDSQQYEASAAQVIAYYTAALPADAIDADLSFFAKYYLDSSNDIHLAARILFDSRMDRMPAEEVERLAEEYIPSLPSQRPTGKEELGAASMALTVLGGMALHRYHNISPAALKSVAESITLYLASDDPSRLGLAIELASKGFSTWQTFIDPAEMLRRLFYFSTHNLSSSSDSSSNVSNVQPSSSSSSIAAQARLAVLHVASTNPALFMSTLSMDILDAKTVEGRKSIMKLCVYMARKKPEVLENSLPKVVEAVVKSLDPNVGKMREDVQQTATVILSELVLAFSTVDFHSASQRLAMGTREGAVIMYDLKTASRLYVLEPHKHPVSAVMFSPDGRRLVTVSLEEGDITVWKVGSSLSGFFNVGGPPRQGGEKGEPFKRIEFARADDGPLKSTTALSDIQITWPGQKQVKVVINETALTFEA